VQKFDGNGNFIKQWGTWVPIEHCYTSCLVSSCTDICKDSWSATPTAIAVDTAGNVYILHESVYDFADVSSLVFKYDSNGRFLTRWGRGDGQYDLNPPGIAVDNAGKVYVANSDHNRIQKFGGKGKLLSKWGSWGTGDGQFVGPRGIAVDSSGNVYVADTENHRIQKFEQTFTIKGAVKKANGTPIAGVLMTISGAVSETTTTDTSGKYRFENIPNGSYTVTPSKTGFDFNLASTDVTVYGADVTGQDFTGATFFISGIVKKANGTPIAGVLMTLSGDADKTVTTNSTGRYKFINIAGGNYTITPNKEGFTFAPASITLAISGASVRGQNFIGTKN
jgi:hypothetical protein